MRAAKAGGRVVVLALVLSLVRAVDAEAQVARSGKEPAVAVASPTNEEMRAYVHGNTAVVTGWLVMRGRGASGAFDRRFRYTDTWLYRGGRWRVIAAHDYLVPSSR